MNKLKVLLSVMAMSFVMIGCGGGGGSPSSSLDNSILASESNVYGYIGESVVFGNIEVTGGWDLYSTDTFTDFYGYFNSDGTGYLRTTKIDVFDWRIDFVYGVSKDGRVINTSEAIKLTIIGIIEDGATFSYNGEIIAVVDCYKVKYEDGIGGGTFDMCPDGSRFINF